MIMQCAELEIITADQKTRLFATLSARGWRRTEPLDEIVDLRRPSVLKRCFEVLIGRGLVSPRDIPSAWAWTIRTSRSWQDWSAASCGTPRLIPR